MSSWVIKLAESASRKRLTGVSGRYSLYGSVRSTENNDSGGADEGGGASYADNTGADGAGVYH